MATQIEVANRALSKIGAARITSLDDNNVQARAVSAAFNIVRDDEIRAHGWSFAMRRTVLSASTETPAFGGAYVYPLPTDCLRLWMIGDWYWMGPDMSDYRASGDPVYTVEGRSLLTSQPRPADAVPGAVRIRYLAQVADTTQWDANFVEAFACRLAVEIADELTQSATKKNGMWQEYDQAIRRARRTNAIELPPEYIQDDTWVLSRFRN